MNDTPCKSKTNSRKDKSRQHAEKIARLTTEILLKKYTINPDTLATRLLEKEKEFYHDCQKSMHPV
jgi:hypothetical protein